MGFAACLAISLTMYLVRERRERSAFICRLLPAQREGLRGFKSIKGDWREFRDLCLDLAAAHERSGNETRENTPRNGPLPRRKPTTRIGRVMRLEGQENRAWIATSRPPD